MGSAAAISKPGDPRHGELIGPRGRGGQSERAAWRLPGEDAKEDCGAAGFPGRWAALTGAGRGGRWVAAPGPQRLSPGKTKPGLVAAGRYALPEELTETFSVW